MCIVYAAVAEKHWSEKSFQTAERNFELWTEEKWKEDRSTFDRIEKTLELWAMAVGKNAATWEDGSEKMPQNKWLSHKTVSIVFCLCVCVFRTKEEQIWNL